MSDIKSVKSQGFTLVELLIVIVVIAILASISVVAYNGIQTRAENTKTSAAVNAYLKALKQYKILNGEYPVGGAMCLGDDYKPFSGSSTPACRYQSSAIAQSANASQRDLLKPLLGGQLPMPSTKPVVIEGNEFVGIYFYGTAYNLHLDGEPVVALTYTYLTQECPVGQSYRSSGWPNLSSSARGIYQITGDGARCMLLLPA